MILTQALTTGSVLSIVFTVAILGSLAYNPRLWIGDAPKAMQEAVAPLSAREKRDRMLFAIPFFVLIFGIPLWSVLTMKVAQDGLTFAEAFVHLWIIFMVVNVVDLVLIDWLILMWWQPKFTYTPDMKPLLHHITYRYHFNAHLKGSVMMTVLAAVLALIVSLL